MGSLLLGSALTGLGRGISKDAENKVEAQAADEDREHDRRMESMRQRFLNESREDTQLFQAGENVLTRDAATTTAEIQMTGQKAIAAGDRASRETIAVGDQTSREAISASDQASREGIAGAQIVGRERVALIDAWMSRNNKKSINTKGGWTIKTSIIPGFPDEDGNPTTEITILATRNGVTWQQKGQKMFPAGGKLTPNFVFETVQEERDAIDDLLADLGNKTLEQDFIDATGYLPAQYMEVLSMDANSSLAEFIEQNWRGPAYDMGGGGTPAIGAPTNAQLPSPVEGAGSTEIKTPTDLKTPLSAGALAKAADVKAIGSPEAVPSAQHAQRLAELQKGSQKLGAQQAFALWSAFAKDDPIDLNMARMIDQKRTPEGLAQIHEKYMTDRDSLPVELQQQLDKLFGMK